MENVVKTSDVIESSLEMSLQLMQMFPLTARKLHHISYDRIARQSLYALRNKSYMLRAQLI